MAPTLGYWKVRGRAEAIRYLLHFAEVDFEDKRYEERSDYLNVKHDLGLDFPNLPYYIDGDVKLSQSAAIIHHLARKHGLWPQEEAEIVRAELAEHEIVDLRKMLVSDCWYGAKEHYQTNRENTLRALPSKLQQWSAFLGDRPFIAGDKLTYVDFLVFDLFDVTQTWEATILDDFPNLKAYVSRVADLPRLAGYRASDKFAQSTILGPAAAWGS
ncbi:Glutathione S-transferase Mu 1 [Halotydeus destructor]|nr:Glutathione S-transferase Mu 1 [Halotydeus destructor]